VRRARRWPLRLGLLSFGLFAVAAPMVAAEPASAPLRSETAEAVATTVATARPAVALRAEVAGSDQAFTGVGDVALVAGAVAAQAAAGLEVPPPPTTTTTAPPTTTTTTTAPPPPPAPAPAPAPEPATGRCGGDLPPCWVMMRESGGNITAKNPTSSASGKWQFINSTWAGYGGYAEAWMAPESVQDGKARELWAGGAGCGHWSAC
jgi:hypothetical protein